MRKTAYLIIIIIVITLVGCTHKSSSSSSILPPHCKLQEGDIVFRMGGGLTSYAVISADPTGSYSHIGIVVDSAGHKMIVHAVPGEPDFEGDPDRVKIDTPQKFFSSLNASRGEICRIKDHEKASQAAHEAIKILRRHVLFDHNYDRTDTTRMYCTELVAFVFNKVGHPLVSPTCGHDINMPGLHAHCLLPSDINKSPLLRQIAHF